MRKEEILADVQLALLKINSDLDVRNITEPVELVDGLGLDSLNLANLIESLRAKYSDINFMPWFIEAAKKGQDTVGRLVEFIEAKA